MNPISRSNWYSVRLNRRVVYLAISVAMTVGILGYLFHFVSFADVITAIVGMNLAGLAGFVLLSFTMSALRTLRFLLMLKVSGHHPGKFALFLVVLVRNFCSDLLPARIGTLIYVYLATQRLGVPFSSAASSFALAFLFDIIALAPILLIAALMVGGAGILSPTVLAAGSVFLVGISIGILIALPSITRLGGKTLRVMKVLPKRLRDSWSQRLNDTGEEFEHIAGSGIYWKLFIVSLLVRFCKYGSLFFLLFAMVEPLGYTFADLPVPRVFIGLVAPELAASLPISGIGGFGAYEGTWAVVFELLVFPQDIARLTALSHHLFTQVYGALLGAGALLILALPVFRCAGTGTTGAKGRVN